jgi:hypothetical protein
MYDQILVKIKPVRYGGDDMLENEEKVLVHFSSNKVSIYTLNDNSLRQLCEESISFDGSFVYEKLLEKINILLRHLEKYTKLVNNENIRLYATGIFQKLEHKVQTRLIINIYVNFGLYFNIVKPELEQFYLKNSISVYGEQNIIKGLVHQEFQKVVVCGSFQQHLKDIGNVISILHKHNVTVLSPWTTKVVPETLGTDFILLEGQELKNERDAWRHKYEHMDKFRQSDAIIVCNPDGLIGKGTMFEFGFMVAVFKRIIFTDRPKDLSIPFPYEIGLNFK